MNHNNSIEVFFTLLILGVLIHFGRKTIIVSSDTTSKLSIENHQKLLDLSLKSINIKDQNRNILNNIEEKNKKIIETTKQNIEKRNDVEISRERVETRVANYTFLVTQMIEYEKILTKSASETINNNINEIINSLFK